MSPVSEQCLAVITAECMANILLAYWMMSFLFVCSLLSRFSLPQRHLQWGLICQLEQWYLIVSVNMTASTSATFCQESTYRWREELAGEAWIPLALWFFSVKEMSQRWPNCIRWCWYIVVCLFLVCSLPVGRWFFFYTYNYFPPLLLFRKRSI